MPEIVQISGKLYGDHGANTAVDSFNQGQDHMRALEDRELQREAMSKELELAESQIGARHRAIDLQERAFEAEQSEGDAIKRAYELDARGGKGTFTPDMEFTEQQRLMLQNSPGGAQKEMREVFTTRNLEEQQRVEYAALGVDFREMQESGALDNETTAEIQAMMQEGKNPKRIQQRMAEISNEHGALQTRMKQQERGRLYIAELTTGLDQNDDGYFDKLDALDALEAKIAGPRSDINQIMDDAKDIAFGFAGRMKAKVDQHQAEMAQLEAFGKAAATTLQLEIDRLNQELANVGKTKEELEDQALASNSPDLPPEMAAQRQGGVGSGVAQQGQGQSTAADGASPQVPDSAKTVHELGLKPNEIRRIALDVAKLIHAGDQAGADALILSKGIRPAEGVLTDDGEEQLGVFETAIKKAVGKLHKTSEGHKKVIADVLAKAGNDINPVEKRHTNKEWGDTLATPKVTAAQSRSRAIKRLISEGGLKRREATRMYDDALSKKHKAAARAMGIIEPKGAPSREMLRRKKD
ncbi:MAG: hypothetical protein OSB57_01730 [Planctomycetota bacterium]|nr:hypothetical protein [Planctomycetota bacterium]